MYNLLAWKPAFVFAVLVFRHFTIVSAGERWREVLLGQARQRILTWLRDSTLVEACGTREGITLHMLKEDQLCAGDHVPVTFAEFDVSGVRPVDIFRVMLNTPDQKKWNPQASSITDLGAYPELGARAWAVVFDLPVIKDREFFQWQVASADIEKQEFWLAFSTENNEKLKAKSALATGAKESENCLGGYHITLNAQGGAHVVITQHVNAHPFFPFPLHQIMVLFPPAWTGTLEFVHELEGEAKKLFQLGAPPNHTGAPWYMLSDSSITTPPLPALETTPSVTPPVVASAAPPAPTTTQQSTTTKKDLPKWMPKWMKKSVHGIQKTFGEATPATSPAGLPATMVGDHASGTTSLHVDHPENFAVGQKIVIDKGKITEEENIVKSSDSFAMKIHLQTPTKFSHSNGAQVVRPKALATALPALRVGNPGAATQAPLASPAATPPPTVSHLSDTMSSGSTTQSMAFPTLKPKPYRKSSWAIWILILALSAACCCCVAVVIACCCTCAGKDNHSDSEESSSFLEDKESELSREYTSGEYIDNSKLQDSYYGRENREVMYVSTNAESGFGRNVKRGAQLEQQPYGYQDQFINQSPRTYQDMPAYLPQGQVVSSQMPGWFQHGVDPRMGGI
jgi:hypothetical protein